MTPCVKWEMVVCQNKYADIDLQNPKRKHLYRVWIGISYTNHIKFSLVQCSGMQVGSV